jgi:hypothetical protein
MCKKNRYGSGTKVNQSISVYVDTALNVQDKPVWFRYKSQSVNQSFIASKTLRVIVMPGIFPRTHSGQRPAIPTYSAFAINTLVLLKAENIQALLLSLLVLG